MRTRNIRVFHINLNDWTWWIWTVTAALLAVGLSGTSAAFIAAILLTVGQAVLFLVLERSLAAFSVQLRLAYLVLLMVCFLPAMHWLYWLPTIGTFALIVFGYCLLARCLSLLPWNSHESYSLDRMRRTFFSRPDVSRLERPSEALGCVGGLCTIEAQVAPAQNNTVG